MAPDVLVVLAVGLMVEYRSRDRAGAFPSSSPAIYEILARQPRGVVAEFPAPRPSSLPGGDPGYAYMSTLHWFPLVNGYGGNYPVSVSVAVDALTGFPTPGRWRSCVGTASGISSCTRWIRAREMADPRRARVRRHGRVRTVRRRRRNRPSFTRCASPWHRRYSGWARARLMKLIYTDLASPPPAVPRAGVSDRRDSSRHAPRPRPTVRL